MTRNLPQPQTRIANYGYNVSTPILSKKTQRYNTVRWVTAILFFIFFIIIMAMLKKLDSLMISLLALIVTVVYL